MAPWRETSAASIRQASTTMSWVAEEKPVNTANRATRPRLALGSEPATSSSPAMIATWATSIHDRRWPSHLVRPGTAVRSTSGAHRNLKE